MGRIRLLDDSVINKIAAGEVVERPASVIKELVENALDAGATDIRVDLSEGGRRLISVTDNGSGMDREDAVNCLKRHATSKIRVADDLFQIHSMGFRGEALPSIASVSKFTLVTRPREAPQGTRVIAHGDTPLEVLDDSSPEGTRVTIEDLFFNVPARLKFLRSATSEYAHALEIIHAFVLSRPESALTLTHQGREQIRVPAHPREDVTFLGERAMRERARVVCGTTDIDAMLYTRETGKLGSVEALISPPGMDHGTSRHLHFFVNQRWTKDKVLRYAINRAWHTHLPQGRYPAAIVSFTCDPSLVDVNVHPSKTELRFQYAQETQAFIAEVLRARLRSATWAAAEPSGDHSDTTAPAILQSHYSSLSATPSPAAFASPSPGTPAAISWQRPSAFSSTRETIFSIRENATPVIPSPETVIPWKELSYIGSFGQCFLLFEGRQALLAVDQHAFHERIIYERLRRDESLLRQGQRLLVPEAVDLSPTQAAAIHDHLALLGSIGFELAAVGTTTIEVRKVCSLLKGRDLSTLLAEVAEHCREKDVESAREKITTRLLATIACHSAVRSGDDLTREEVTLLVKEAEDVDFYHNCPHGRRVFRWWSRQEVARWFDRP